MFIIKYRQNPIGYHNTNRDELIRAKRLITKSFHNINHKITCLRHHKPNRLNVDKNYRRIIRGLSKIYNFKPRSFIHDNLRSKNQHSYLINSRQRLTISSWLKLIQHLTQQLDTIRNANDLAQIQRRCHGFVYINKIKSTKHHQIADHARKKLAGLGNNRRYRFIGQFARFGRKSNGQLSLLLRHITYHGKEVTNHLWFSYTQGFKKLGHLKHQQLISFKARVKRYHKGYVPLDFIERFDYKLSYPSQITKL